MLNGAPGAGASYRDLLPGAQVDLACVARRLQVMTIVQVYRLGLTEVTVHAERAS